MRLTDIVVEVGGAVREHSDKKWGGEGWVVLTIVQPKDPSKSMSCNFHPQQKSIKNPMDPFNKFVKNLRLLEGMLEHMDYGPNKSTMVDKNLIKCKNKFCRTTFEKEPRKAYCSPFCRIMSKTVGGTTTTK